MIAAGPKLLSRIDRFVKRIALVLITMTVRHVLILTGEINAKAYNQMGLFIFDLLKGT